MHWSINSKDWLNPGTEQIVANVTNDLDPGDIVLLHASDSAKQTAKALPKIIEVMKENGYKNASLSELLANGKAESKGID